MTSSMTELTGVSFPYKLSFTSFRSFFLISFLCVRVFKTSYEKQARLVMSCSSSHYALVISTAQADCDRCHIKWQKREIRWDDWLIRPSPLGSLHMTKE
jgi:hypothetical protein